MKKITLLLLLFPIASIFAQQKKISDFEWELQFHKNRITINCIKGCTFNTMQFKANRTVTFNQFGMVDLKKDTSTFENSDFIIVYNKHHHTVTYTGLKGVNWETISHNNTISLNHKLTPTALEPLPQKDEFSAW